MTRDPSKLVCVCGFRYQRFRYGCPACGSREVVRLADPIEPIKTRAVVVQWFLSRVFRRAA